MTLLDKEKCLKFMLLLSLNINIFKCRQKNIKNGYNLYSRIHNKK